MKLKALTQREKSSDWPQGPSGDREHLREPLPRRSVGRCRRLAFPSAPAAPGDQGCRAGAGPGPEVTCVAAAGVRPASLARLAGVVSVEALG
jgi:hypothetical protein